MLLQADKPFEPVEWSQNDAVRVIITPCHFFSQTTPNPDDSRRRNSGAFFRPIPMQTLRPLSTVNTCSKQLFLSSVQNVPDPTLFPQLANRLVPARPGSLLTGNRHLHEPESKCRTDSQHHNLSLFLFCFVFKKELVSSLNSNAHHLVKAKRLTNNGGFR
jgi:hypothetical protein